jgi:hypothetical protein
VQKITADAGAGMMPESVQLNLLVTGGPDGDCELHLGDGAFGSGLLDDCPTKLTMPYDVAKSMFVKGDQTAAMQAFMSGQIKVEGDMTRLMAMQGQMQGGGNDPAQAAIRDRLREITADA